MRKTLFVFVVLLGTLGCGGLVACTEEPVKTPACSGRAVPINAQPTTNQARGANGRG